MRLLAIDTATEACSVALIADGRVHARWQELERGHSDRILPMVQEVLAEAGLALADLQALDALAFGRGPGAFTGVRLAASVAQGLALGAGLGVVPVSNLLALAQGALDADPGRVRVLACADARMGELYWGAFERDRDGLAVAAGDERVALPANVALPAGWAARTVAGVGRGFRAYPALGPLAGTLAAVLPDALPDARAIARLAVPCVAAGRVLPPEEALPVYLRDDVAKTLAEQGR